jgi:hypothetical protein
MIACCCRKFAWLVQQLFLEGINPGALYAAQVFKASRLSQVESVWSMNICQQDSISCRTLVIFFITYTLETFKCKLWKYSSIRLDHKCICRWIST